MNVPELISQQLGTSLLNIQTWGNARYNVKAYMAKGNGVTDDRAAIQAAINAANAGGGGIVLLPPGTYLISGTLSLYTGVMLEGAGAGVTVVHHTGNNAGIQLYPPVKKYNVRTGIRHLSITGNAGTAAIGIEIADTLSFEFERVMVHDYTNGIGVKLYNLQWWTEGTIMQDLAIQNCLRGLVFERGGGTNSFAYTRIYNLMINVPENGIGVDIGSNQGGPVYVYHSIFNTSIWLDVSNNATAFFIRNSASVEKSDLFIAGESLGGTGQVGLKVSSASLKGIGSVTISGAPNDISTGLARLISPNGRNGLDNMSGVDGTGNTYQTMLTGNVDVDTAGAFGLFSRNNVNSPFVSMYDSGGNGFAIMAIPFNKTIAQGKTVCWVAQDGSIYPQTNVSGAAIRSGTVDPNNSVSGNTGDIYIRKGGNGSAGLLYVKRVDNTTTNWSLVQGLDSGTTAGGRTTGVPVGYQFFDTTLGKPIWWNGTVWKDAAGTTV